MKNKTILALAIASTLGLTACGDETTALRIDDTIKDSLNRQSSIAFDLISSAKVISIPTYLAMDAKNGTLFETVAGASTDRKDPKLAMGDTDGWSPTQPFVIELDLPTGVTLTTDSTLLHAAVKVAKVTVKDYVMSSLEALTAGVDYTVISTGTSLAVLPRNGSLEHGSDYIYAITDALVDSSGEKLGMSTSYAALKNKQIDQTGGSLEVPQKIVLQVEGLMDGYGIANYENIIYSSWFTTSSAGESLYSVKIATALTLAQGGNGSTVWPDDANPNGEDLTTLYALTLDAAQSGVHPYSGDLNYNTGTLKLPSFLEREPAKFSNTPWQSAIPSLAIISGVLNGSNEANKAELGRKLVAAGIDPTNLKAPTEQLKLVGKSFTVGGKALDSERLITKYSPLPQVKVVEEVPFLLITPKTANPVAKVPVVIYQHGITSLKENILASGDALINNYAILAIDLPLHGARGIPKGDGTFFVADADNASIFMNFGYLNVGRDNMRQAVADLIGLRAGITIVGAAQQYAFDNAPGKILGNNLDLINTQKVSFFGHSLGAMTGISLQATIDRPLPDSDGDGVVGDGYFKIDKAVFSNPGGGVPYLLLNSEEFGGTVKHGLMAASDTQDEDSNGYINFIGAKCELGVVGTPDDDKPLKNNTACFNGYYDHIETLKPGTQAVIDATFQSFAVAAQTVLETADPFALARNISADTPIYLAQVKGDTVIPNILEQGAGYAAPYSPIGGTTPLIAQFGLTNVNPANTLTKKVALLNAGEHSSAIFDFTGVTDTDGDITNPNANTDITIELQGQISSFLEGDGSTVTVGDTNLLD